MGDVGKFLGGVVLLGAGLAAQFIPGVGNVLGSLMMSYGVNMMAAGIFASRNVAERQEDAQQMTVSTVAPLPVVYGETKLGIKVADVRVDDGSHDRRVLWLVGAVCHGSRDGSDIEGLGAIEFNGRPAFNAAGTPQDPFDGTPAFFTGTVAGVQKRLGSDSQAVLPDLDSTFTEWTTDHAGKGVAYLAFRLIKTEQFASVPNPTVEVKGNHVLDLRDDTWKYSKNPALCIYDYMRSEIYGMGIPASEIDEPSFIDAANYCDESVSTPDGSQPRFELSGWVDTAREPPQNLMELLSSCRGEMAYEGGKFRLIIRRAQAVSGVKLDTDNIHGEWSWRLPGNQERPNEVTARYIDPERNWQPFEVRWPEDDPNPLLTADNDQPADARIELPFTQDYYRAQQIAMVFGKEAREALGVQVTCDESALQLQTGDLVEITHDTPGWTEKPFWVMAIEVGQDLTVRLTLMEYEPTVYSLDAQLTAPAIPDTDHPNPFAIDPPTGLRVQLYGVTRPVAEVHWTAPSDAFLSAFHVRARESSDTEWPVHLVVEDRTVTRARVAEVQRGETWVFQVRAANERGIVSDWVQITKAITAGVPTHEEDGITPQPKPPEVEPVNQEDEDKDGVQGVPGLRINPVPTTTRDGITRVIDGDGKVATGLQYPSGERVNDLEPLEGGAEPTTDQPFRILSDRYFEDMVRSATDPTSGDKVISRLDNSGNLTGEAKASDGVGTGGIMRRPYVTTLEDGETFTFPVPYQSTPKFLPVAGGALPGADAGDRVAPIYDIEDLDPSGGTAKFRGIRRTSATSTQSDAFGAGTLDAQGESLELTPSADTADGAYTLTYSFTLNVTSEGSAGTITDSFPSGLIDAVGERKDRTLSADPSGSVTVSWSRTVSATGGPDPQELTDRSEASLTLKVRTNTGSGFTDHSTHSYSASANGGETDSDSGSDSTTISGLSSGDQVRIEVSARAVAIGDGGSAQAYADPGSLEYSSGESGSATLSVRVAARKRQSGGNFQQVDSDPLSVSDSSGSGNQVTGSGTLTFTDDTILGSESDEVGIYIDDVSTSGSVDSFSFSVDPGSAIYKTDAASTTDVSLTDQGDRITGVFFAQ